VEPFCFEWGCVEWSKFVLPQLSLRLSPYSFIVIKEFSLLKNKSVRQIRHQLGMYSCGHYTDQNEKSLYLVVN